jgi:hypothetical protein
VLRREVDPLPEIGSRAAEDVELGDSMQREYANLDTIGRQDPIITGAGLIPPIARIFLHFFDPHFMDEITRGRNAASVISETESATRLAILASGTVFVPAASYVESDLCRRIVDCYQPLFSSGQVVLVAGEANLVDYAESKLLQYEPEGVRYQNYSEVVESGLETPPYRRRGGSATRDITRGWLAKTDHLASLAEDLHFLPRKALEEKWSNIPTALDGRAFTPEYVYRLLTHEADSGEHLVFARRAGSFINSEYFRSYTNELNAGVVTDMNYLSSPNTGAGIVNLPYLTLIRTLTEEKVVADVKKASAASLVELRADPRVAKAFLNALGGQVQSAG